MGLVRGLGVNETETLYIYSPSPTRNNKGVIEVETPLGTWRIPSSSMHTRAVVSIYCIKDISKIFQGQPAYMRRAYSSSPRVR